jgi:hypothetical protein
MYSICNINMSRHSYVIKKVYFYIINANGLSRNFRITQGPVKFLWTYSIKCHHQHPSLLLRDGHSTITRPLRNEGGYHEVVSQTEIEVLNKKLNIFRTTSASLGV